ncbi:T9SS type A sorting domain-containing protein [Rasiella rasia]|uniref:T9SS type A sorting domain-containing protein n=1 Tax=Rasiella rasia TaxID=2744027 RepID=A0A6G6GP45_9FLAO|nr:T9SS type A sorting domain-containing protein [Rasiella rasia]QIE60322.1 T9SS type A sorting domain-containing protein [Rasiella rasia]
MKPFITSILLISFAFISCGSPSEELQTNSASKTLPADFMFMQRAYPTGSIKPNALNEALTWKEAQKKSQRNVLNVWEFAGPLNIGGRITDIEIPNDDATTYYVGAASGGIFKTTDGGANWQPIFDEVGVLSIGDIEISKANTDVIWVGTGEVNAGGGSLVYDGKGVYKSEDGGATWNNKGLPTTGSIGKVLIDPTNEDNILVAAMGPLFRNDNNRGVYRSQDGGDTWSQVLFVSEVTGAIDMAIHPTNGAIIYAAMWERMRRPEATTFGGATSGLYRSTDGGDTWNEMTNGLPSVASEKGRISIDISQSNPDVLYARYANAAGSIQGVYKSTDGGDTWIEKNSSQLQNVGFHWWFRGIYVDPSDENVLYNVDFIVQKSTDGGDSWATAFPNVHVDQHALAFNAQTAGEVLLGNDGGLYYSDDDGASSSKDLSLPITQLYRMYVDPQNEDKVYAGAQDNSTMRTTTGGLTNWNIINGGDGFQPLVDATDTNVIYALSQRGAFVKSTNDGASFSSATSGIAASDRKNWDTPTTFDPSDSQTLYYGANRLYRSTDAAASWTAISPDLTNGSGGGNNTYGTITTIDVSPLDSDLIYVGTDDGNVWVTQNGGNDWTNISVGIPNRWVTKVLADRDDVNRVFVTLSGYRYGEDEGNVYRSSNRGQVWGAIGASLPDIPINDIVKDANGNTFLATDVGVFGAATEAYVWQVIDGNMPSVVVNDLHIHEPSGMLYAATYGRSIYKLDLASVTLSTSEIEDTIKASIFPNPASDVVTIALTETVAQANIVIFDALGREVGNHSFKNQQRLVLSISTLETGSYFVKVITPFATSTKKLIVK